MVAEIELPATPENILYLMMDDMIQGEGCGCNGEVGSSSNTSIREEELNKYEEEFVPIVVSYGEGR